MNDLRKLLWRQTTADRKQGKRKINSTSTEQIKQKNKKRQKRVFKELLNTSFKPFKSNKLEKQ